jgi:hypothetical protein
MEKGDSVLAYQTDLLSIKGLKQIYQSPQIKIAGVETKGELAAADKSLKIKRILGNPWMTKVKAGFDHLRRTLSFNNLRGKRWTISLQKNKKSVNTMKSKQNTFKVIFF